MNGNEVRKLIVENRVKLWEVADRLGVTDSSFSRRLRKSFSDDEVERIKGIIAELKKA